MKHLNIIESNDFSDKAFKRLLIHDSPYFKILNFNFQPGQELLLHAHDIEGEVSILVLEGQGEFLLADNQTLPARAGDMVVCEIAEPHGVRAETAMRIVVTIAPPI